MAGRDIFISYSRDDRAAARHFAKCLEEDGFTVWWDAALHSGESFDQVIERELRAAAAAIVLWSPRSVASRWVRAEATLADRQGKLIPVIIEQCERPIIFELTHTNDLADWIGDKNDPRWKGLVDDIARLVGDRRARTAGPAAEKPAAQPVPFAAALPLQREQQAPPHQPAMVPPQDNDDSQATQFFVGADCQDIFHCLEISTEEHGERRYIVAPQGLRIGRSPPADIILSDRQVSRSHCLVELDGNALRITDLGSTNGTYVDGKRVERSASLAVGSVLTVGTVSMRHQVRSARVMSQRRYAVG
ncbi:TIR domain-containing protein [Sphingomonas glaciei]|uniref:TIR domain-containing protein n=1 Tax=Sphingomonas glaciei TaxID=2938948 RepID=A0ABY5MRP6_9SPHN|nr:TIR domain-containing protein [Sphingomonas glaciei]UUR07164.1 TIR domain-containing protein [Sphingomonas glaciei]